MNRYKIIILFAAIVISLFIPVEAKLIKYNNDAIQARYFTDINGFNSSAWDTKQDALGYTAENVANKGAASGYAPLGADTKIPAQYYDSSGCSDCPNATLASYNGNFPNNTVATKETSWDAKESPLTFALPLYRAVNNILIQIANATNNGYLSSADWLRFDAKQDAAVANTTYAYVSRVASNEALFNTSKNLQFQNDTARDTTTNQTYVKNINFTACTDGDFLIWFTNLSGSCKTPAGGSGFTVANTPLYSNGVTVYAQAGNGTSDGYMPATTLQTNIYGNFTALQNRATSNEALFNTSKNLQYQNDTVQNTFVNTTFSPIINSIFTTQTVANNTFPTISRVTTNEALFNTSKNLEAQNETAQNYITNTTYLKTANITACSGGQASVALTSTTFTCMTPGGGVWNTIKKTSDQIVTNSAVLVNDSQLNFSIAANTNYTFRLYVFYDTTSATADFKYRHAGPSWTYLVRIQRMTVMTGYTTTIVVDTAFSVADVAVTGTGTNGGYVEMNGEIHNYNAPGWFNFRFAQNTATASHQVRVKSGSYIEWMQTN